MMAWYVVAAETDAAPEERVWTLSRYPTITGWETDCGFPGYGMTKRDAQELADAANWALAHPEVVTGARRGCPECERRRSDRAWGVEMGQ